MDANLIYLRDRLSIGGTSCEMDARNAVAGIDHFQKKKHNKGEAFSLIQRQVLGIHGLLPFRELTDTEQVARCLKQLQRLNDDLDKFMYLQDLSEQNQHLFFKLLISNLDEIMPLVYTPVVGVACQNYSLIYRYPQGMFITIKDKGHVYEMLKNWPEKNIRIIIVTDGERVLGLGDLGANGMGIPVAKVSLYTVFGGIGPNQCLPVTLDVGTNTESLLEDRFYIGLHQKRISGKRYHEFIDEFMHAVVRHFGRNCLIQFEDFAITNAFRFLTKYRDSFCTFNDDIQGTAAVVVAGILAALKMRHAALKDNNIMFYGASEAALVIANLLLTAMTIEGVKKENARKCIWFVDSKGLVVRDRPGGGLIEEKSVFVQDHVQISTLSLAVDRVKPNVLIGAAGIGRAFTEEILNNMATFSDEPLIFVLSNPSSKAECTAEEAFKYTNGKCTFVSSLPFEPITLKGKRHYPIQCYNFYIFPGIALGVLCSGMLKIPENVFAISACRLAELVTSNATSKGNLYPALESIFSYTIEIAKCIMDYAYKNHLATVQPEPEDKIKLIKSQMYDISYPNPVPHNYNWYKSSRFVHFD